MPTPFTKYSGCGNDFILIDNRQLQLLPPKNSIIEICHRQLGIGADGLIFLENSTIPDAAYRMRIFNADGSEAEMCGNGLRCLGQFIRSIEDVSDHFFVETMQQRMEISFTEDLINISMPAPTELSCINLPFGAKEISLHCLNTGVPHAIHFVDDLENDQLFLHAPSIRYHHAFKPHGTNVNFAKILPDQSIAIRTYERGVEAETLACGTGAAAVAIASSAINGTKSPIKIRVRSGETITINFKGNGSNLTNLVMTGPAKKIFEGCVDIEKFGFQLKSSSLIR